MKNETTKHTKLYNILEKSGKWFDVLCYILKDPDTDVKHLNDSFFMDWFLWNTTKEGNDYWSYFNTKMIKGDSCYVNEHDMKNLRSKYPEMFV